jgi:leucyl-tRNA synthetase
MARATHRLVQRVTHDLERWSYNTAVAALREHTNLIYRYVQSPEGPARGVLDHTVDTTLLLLAPMAPHLVAELWERRRGEDSAAHAQPWPVADPAMLADETVTLVVQVNGKLRDKVDVAPTASEDEVVAVAMASPKVAALLEGRPPRRVIARPPTLVNVVV